MRRLSIFAVTLVAAHAAPAAAEEALTSGGVVDAPGAAGDPLALDERQVALAADLGLSGGGVGTPGGLRVGGHYLYRLADRDWFDGGLAFTFGGGGDACLAGGEMCRRDVADGFAADLTLGVRRELAPRGGFTPWLRLAGFARALRFDDIGGLAVGGELGAGVRAPVRGELAVVAGAHAFYGVADLGEPMASDRQLGLTVSVGAEVGLR